MPDKGAAPYPDTSLVILCGGLASRMGGWPKGLIEIGGVPIVKRQIDMFGDLFAEILIVANIAEPYENFGERFVSDIKPGLGPLGGLYTALMTADCDKVFLIACDMPFIIPEAVGLVMETDKSSLVVAPEIGGKPEPLFVRVHKNALSAIESALERGDYKMTGFYTEAGAVFVREERFRKIDPKLRTFININDEEDLEKLLLSD